MGQNGRDGGTAQAPPNSSNGNRSNGNRNSSGSSLPEMLINSKFWVQVGAIVQAYFMECTGLQAQTDVFEYAEGGLNGYTHKLPGRTTIGNVTLKRGLVELDHLWNWYSDVMEGRIVRHNITIMAVENKSGSSGEPLAVWILKDALPVKWIGPSFKASDGSVAVDQLEFVCGAIDGSGALSRLVT